MRSEWLNGSATSGQAWRDIRGVRASLSTLFDGSTNGIAANADRSSTIAASLEQAEQLCTAARGAGPATRALPLYYALQCAARAVVAASISIQNDEPNLGGVVPWGFKHHGISSIPSSNELADCVVKLAGGSAGNTCWDRLCAVLESGSITGETRLATLWSMLMEARTTGLLEETPCSVVTLDIPSRRDPVDSRTIVGYIRHIPVHNYIQLHRDRPGTIKYLEHFPSLRGYQLKDDVPNFAHWSHGAPAPASLRLEWPLFVHPTLLRSELAVPYRGDFIVMPSLDGMRPMHPFLAWYAVLHALSTYTRYQPLRWSRIIHIDQSEVAIHVEMLLEHAMDALPSVIFEALSLVSDRPHKTTDRLFSEGGVPVPPSASRLIGETDST